MTSPAPQGHVIFAQPSLPSYRPPFFAGLAAGLGARLLVYTSAGDLGALTAPRPLYDWERRLGRIRALGIGLVWQDGALAIPLARGDVMVLSGAPRFLTNIGLLIKARWRGAHVIWWGHYRSATTKPWRLKLRTWLMKPADALLFYTDDEVAAYKQVNPAETRPVLALNNGIDAAPVRSVRQTYSAQHRPQDLLFLGRITEKARLDLAVEALAQTQNTQSRLQVIGDGPRAQALQDRARALGVAERITWHGAKTAESEIAAIANRCRAFLYPGAIGLSLIHAMHYGLPTITHDAPAQHMPEIAAFRDRVTGLAFREGEAADLAACIDVLISDTARLEEMSIAALTVADGFTTEEMAARLLAYIRRLDGGGEA